MKTGLTTELPESQRSCKVWADARSYREGDGGKETSRGWSVREMEEGKRIIRSCFILKVFVMCVFTTNACTGARELALTTVQQDAKSTLKCGERS